MTRILYDHRFTDVTMNVPAAVGVKIETPTGKAELVSVVKYEGVTYGKAVVTEPAKAV